MVTTDALKLLYKKLGGTADVDNITAISDMVDLIEDVAGGGGGGASGLVVNIIRDLTAVPPTISLDKNYTEITTALLSGIHPVVLTEAEGSYDVETIVGFSDAEGYSVSTANDTFTSESADGVLTLA